MPSTRARCPKCYKFFRQLDTHLRVSATCRDVHERPQDLATPPSKSMNTIVSTVNSNSAASYNASLCGSLNSTATASAVGTTYSLATPLNGSTSLSLHFKHPLRLPSTSEKWEEADHPLSSVSASVLCAGTAEEKNSCLCTGVYNILSACFGTRAPPTMQEPAHSKIRQHNRVLKEVTRLKNEARRAFRRAKREGASDDIIQSLAANFLSLLRQHSRLSRESSTRLKHKEAGVAREESHRNFWRFAKNLLDEGSTSQISPAFSASTAHSFFSEVYDSTLHQFVSPF